MKYSFTDLIDIVKLQELTHRLHAMTGIPVAIIDAQGSILIATGWQEICTRFHRAHPVTAERCRESDNYILNHLDELPYAQYRCQNGLWDIAMPVFLEESHLATLFVGQFHFEDDRPDRGFFRAQAEEFGFDVADYLAALDRLPVFSREKVQAIIDYYLFFVNYLVDEGVGRLERLRTEDELHHSQQLLSSILNCAPYAFFVKDVADDFRIMVWNRAAEEIFGVRSGEMLGKNAHDLWPPEQANRFREDDLAVVADRIMVDIPELVSTHPVKGEIYLHVRKLPLFDQNGEVSHLVVICEDITEHRRMQHELFRSQKLESLGVLAGGIAHDFNNILTGILGNISLAQRYLDAGHKSHGALCQAEQAAKRATELAHQLLTFARGGQPITRAVATRHLVEESLSLILRGTNVKGVLEAADGLDALEADPGQVSQAFNNLVINAVQAMPSGGTLTIQAENITLDDINPYNLPAGRYVRFLFSDEGCGIAPEILGNVFDPYFTTKPGGTGLGLASVHSIVAKHGGSIQVSSVVGSGTVFEMLLPSTDAALAEPEGVAPGADGHSGGGRLLIMDDEEIIRSLLTEMLEDFGYRVDACESGDEALALYSTAQRTGTPYEGVIMDLTIPGGMGGVETARRILDLDPEARLIVSSGYSSDPVMADFTAYGFCAAIIKPYRVGDVEQVLNECLSQKPHP